MKLEISPEDLSSILATFDKERADFNKRISVLEILVQDNMKKILELESKLAIETALDKSDHTEVYTFPGTYNFPSTYNDPPHLVDTKRVPKDSDKVNYKSDYAREYEFDHRKPLMEDDPDYVPVGEYDTLGYDSRLA